MPEQIIKESETSVRITVPKEEVVELSSLKKDLEGIDAFIQRQTNEHNKRISELNKQKELIQARINAAVSLGVKEKSAIAVDAGAVGEIKI